MRENPGQRDGLTITPRNCLFEGVSDGGVLYGAGVIDDDNAYDGANTGKETEIRAGTPLAKITATGLWVPTKRTTVAETGTVTALVVTDARAFKVGDVISVGSDTSITITDIDYATNTLTIASTAVVAGEAVICTSLAGSEITRMILNQHIYLQTGKPFETTTVPKQFDKGIIRGLVNDDLILGDLAAIRAAEQAATVKYLAGILWSDYCGLN